MSLINPSLKLIMNLAKAQAMAARALEQRLAAHGIGFSDFAILLILHQAQEGKLRRIDLAEKIGLTASGITRLLMPLEKIGLIRREAYERDARVSYVSLTEAGKRIFEEALVSANAVSLDVLPANKIKKTDALNEFLSELGGNIIP